MSTYGKQRGRRAPTFVMLRHDMMESPAWLSLSLKARCTWLEIQKRWRNGTDKNDGGNNGNIPLSCREVATLLKISKNSAAKAFDELIERGFVKVGRGSNFNLKRKEARRWTLTHESISPKKLPTNEWKKWEEKI